MIDQALHAKVYDTSWKTLFRVGGWAALLAGVLFRRNLGVEISLFSAQKPPLDVAGWFALLQENRLLGLAYLSIFDVVNYALVALMFLALLVALWQVNKSYAALGAALGFLGIAVYFASNTALSMLALSDSYTAATEAQKPMILAAGEAMLALGRFGVSGAHPGSGGYLSLLFVAAGGLLFSVCMLRSPAFGKTPAYMGVAAHTLDLVYCAAVVFAPALGATLAVIFLPAAGLLYMVWHILVGWRLLRLPG